MAGIRYESAIENTGTVGEYWTSTVSSTASRTMYFSRGDAGTDYYYRDGGLCVRCIQN